MFFTKSRAKPTTEVAKTLENVCWRAFGAKQYYFEHRWRHLWSISALIASRRAEISTVLDALGRFPRRSAGVSMFRGEQLLARFLAAKKPIQGVLSTEKQFLAVFSAGREPDSPKIAIQRREAFRKSFFSRKPIFGAFQSCLLGLRP